MKIFNSHKKEICYFDSSSVSQTGFRNIKKTLAKLPNEKLLMCLLQFLHHTFLKVWTESMRGATDHSCCGF